MTRTIEFANNEISIDQLPASLQCLIFLLSQTKNLTSDQVYQSLLHANVTQDELMPWATFDHPLTDCYGRQLVYDGGYFEIMVMSWLPGDVSAIHDHGQAQWGAVQCFGQGRHTVYELNDRQQLHTLAELPLFPSRIVEVNHDLIHQMSNYSQERFLSLHVYGCYDFNEAITGDARIFDLLEGNIQYTNGGVFFCLPETEINHRGQTIDANYATTLRHHQQMSDRIIRIVGDSRDSNLNLAYWQSKLGQVENAIEELSQTESLIR